MNAAKILTPVMRKQLALTALAHFPALATMDTLEMVHTAKV